jgi:hypothetical protein
MRITYRTLWLRIVVMAEKPQETWPMMPVGVIFCINDDPAIDNSFIEFSTHAVPALPVILISITSAIGTDFCLPKARLEDVAVDPLYQGEFELREAQVVELDDNTPDVAKELFRLIVREHEAHKERENLFRIKYRLEPPRKPTITTQRK